MPKGVGPVFAGLVVVPRWPSTDGGYSPYLSWQGAEESICASKSVTSRYDDSGAKLTKAGQTDTAGLRLIASRAKTGAFAGETLFNSDIAVENGYAYQGDYQGVSIRDVRDPSNPTLVNQIVCPGSQNDVTINDGILITSTDSRRTNDGCNSTSTSTPTSPTTWEGLKVWDVRDIRNPEDPKVLSPVGKKVLFTDELGGGSQPTCNSTVGPNRGADAIYDITDSANPKFMSYFKMPRDQTNFENCVAHNGNAMPVKELAWFDRGPCNDSRLVLGGFWSSYYYNGFIYGSEIQRGFDVFKATGGEFSAADRARVRTLNAQTQF